jgi:hypothetical protein
MTFEKGVRKKKTKGNWRTWKGGGSSSTRRKDIQDVASRYRITNWISGGGDQTAKQNVDIKPLVFT